MSLVLFTIESNILRCVLAVFSFDLINNSWIKNDTFLSFLKRFCFPTWFLSALINVGPRCTCFDTLSYALPPMMAFLFFIYHCAKRVQIQSFFWSVVSCIRTEYRKIRTRKTPYLGTFHAVNVQLIKSRALVLSWLIFRGDSTGWLANGTLSKKIDFLVK